MLSGEPTNHETDCYFFLTKIFGFNTKNKQNIQYGEVTSVTKTVLTVVTVYRTRSQRFAEYFTKKDHLCFCHDARGLFQIMNQHYNSEEWRLFIDLSKTSLKAVLLHNGNQNPSIPIGHAINSQESYETMSKLIKLIRYQQYNWKICGDLKVISLLLGFQSGYTKYCCFLCLWDSTARGHHNIKTCWSVRNDYRKSERGKHLFS